MANIFGILTALVLAASAFIALKNKEAYGKEIQDTAVAKDELKDSQELLKKTEGDLASAKENVNKVDQEIPVKKAEEDTQSAKNDEIQTAINAKKAEIEPNKAKLEQVREQTQALGNIGEMSDRLKKMNAEMEETEQSITAAEAKLANVTSEVTRLDTVLAGQRNEIERSSRGESYSDLNTHITAVYGNWGFVTLADGNNAGVITNSTLDVIRGGDVIAKLLVTAVESRTASASIVPDSLAEGVSVEPGDEVVPGTKAAASPAN